MAKLLSTIVDGFISSKRFVSGLLGEGWRIGKRNDRYTLEVDDIVVRNTMTVFELLISKIRAVKGALGISQASGKIKAVTSDEHHFFIEVEGTNAFRVDDIIRCMEVGDAKREYWVVVSGVEGNTLTIARAEFGNEVPQAGDEIVQFGNVSDKRRQSAIYLYADENGEPAIDVLFDIREKSFEGCTKIHLGGEMPGYPEVKGFYCENGMIRSENENGEVIYCLYPDGSGMMAKGNIRWDAEGNGNICNRSIYWDQDGFHFSPDVKLTWESLPDDMKWIEEWSGTATQIGDNYVISPRIFSGTQSEDGLLTGIALGRGILIKNEYGEQEEKTGIFGLKDGKATFEISAETGEAMYRGQLDVNGKTRIDVNGKLFTEDADIRGKITSVEGQIGGFRIGPDYLEKDGLKLSSGYISYNSPDAYQSTYIGVNYQVSRGVTTNLYVENRMPSTGESLKNCAVFNAAGRYLSIGCGRDLLKVEGSSSFWEKVEFERNSIFNGAVYFNNLSVAPGANYYLCIDRDTKQLYYR